MIFWQERVLFADASWIAFRILNWGTLQIQEHRYGSFITQNVPLLAMKTGLPPEGCFDGLCVVVQCLLSGRRTGIVSPWRQHRLMVMLALYFTLSISVGFYGIKNVVYAGMAWLLLFFGWIFRQHANCFLFGW